LLECLWHVYPDAFDKFSCFSLAEVLKGYHLHVLRCNSFGLGRTGSQMNQKDLERSFFVAADGSYICVGL